MLHSRHSSLCRQRGNALLVTAIAIVLLVAVAGAGIDLGRHQLIHARLQQSSDAAALAGSLLVGSDTAPAAAQRYYTLNYSTSDGTYMGVQMPAPSITPGTGTLQVAATSAPIKNQFVTLGHSSSAVAGASTVSTESSGAATKYDVIFILDKSDSMNTVDPGQTDPRFTLTMTAAKTVADTLFTDGSGNQIGAVAYYYAVDGGDKKSPTGDQNAFDNFLNGVQCEPKHSKGDGGITIGTDSTPGLADAFTSAQSSFRAGAVHVVILLTDGENNTVNNEPLFQCIRDLGTAQACLDASDQGSEAICSKFKNTNLPDTPTLIYTIGYGPQGGDPGVFLGTCASGTAGSNLNQYYFVAPDPVALAAVFQTIIGNVEKIRITN